MRQEQILTKGEYVYSRKSAFDTVIFYSWGPFLVIFMLLGVAAFNENTEGMRTFAFLEIPALVLAVICRNIYAKKEADYIMDYYNQYLPSLK